jgi:hypothetical protein
LTLPATLWRSPENQAILVSTPARAQTTMSQEEIMIKKVTGGYKVLSEDGKKNLGGPYKTKKEAEKRLRQVEYFKHRK